MVYSDALGKLIHEKNQKSEILWHCPFNWREVFEIFCQIFFCLNVLYAKPLKKWSTWPLLIGMTCNKQKKKKKKNRVKYLKIFYSCKQMTQISWHSLLTCLLLQRELREMGGVHRCYGPTGKSPICLLVNISLAKVNLLLFSSQKNSAGQIKKCSWSRIHERTITSLRFLGTMLRVLRLEVSVWTF